jgi:hypothetical protein
MHQTLWIERQIITRRLILQYQSEAKHEYTMLLNERPPSGSGGIEKHQARNYFGEGNMRKRGRVSMNQAMQSIVGEQS